MTWEDPIVAEVRRVREMLSAQFNFDAAAIFADLRSRQEAAGDRLVRLQEPRQDSPTATLPTTPAGGAAAPLETPPR